MILPAPIFSVRNVSSGNGWFQLLRNSMDAHGHSILLQFWDLLPGFLRGAPTLVEPGGQRVPSLSRWAGLCLHPFIACAMGRMRGVLSAPRCARILVSAPPLPGRPIHESLQGRQSWPLSTPRRCHVACSDLRVHRMSPVCTVLFRAQATIAFPCLNRTPVHKPYVPRPTYVAVSIDLAARYPTGRES